MPEKMKFVGNTKKISEKLKLVDFNLNDLFKHLYESTADTEFVSIYNELVELLSKHSKNIVYLDIYEGVTKDRYTIKVKIINSQYVVLNDYIKPENNTPKDTDSMVENANKDDLPF